MKFEGRRKQKVKVMSKVKIVEEKNPFQKKVQALIKEQFIDKTLKFFENIKTYNEPEFLRKATDKFALLYEDLNVVWDEEMEERRKLLKEIFEVDPEFVGLNVQKLKENEVEMRRYLKYELDITMDNKQKVKELTVMQRNLNRMKEFKKKNTIKCERINKLFAEIKQ